MTDRWTIRKAYRPARRGSADSVHDGWILHDELLGARRRFETRREARDQIELAEATEELARGSADLAVSFYVSPGVLVAEVWLDLDERAPTRHMKAGLVGAGLSIDSNVSLLLERLGRPDLPPR